MDVVIDQTRVRLESGDLLGEGGEARVFKWRGSAVKVFHPVSTPLDEKLRALKLEKLKHFPSGLPPAVLGPTKLAFDRSGALIGFTMNLADGADDAAKLSQRRYREPHVSNELVGVLFRQLRETLEALHSRGVVVGDLNDGNVLVRPAKREVFVIDADSMQFGGLPCAVAHERFLDPRLYGADLASAPRFDAGTDWYAFAVMLFSSWLYVHPFGGTHATLGTLLRRAEARHSILRSDVTAPRVAASWKTLSDDALDYFTRTFEGTLRDAPPAKVLEPAWVSCTCGVLHARAVCPSCKALGPLSTRPLLRTKGRCTAKTIVETRGRVLAASVGRGVSYVLEEDGVVRREDGAVVLDRALLAQERVSIAGASTWVADARGSLTRVEAGRVVERTQTGQRGVEPIFASAASVTYRAENEWLIEHGSGSRVGQVLDGQTWLWAGERLAAGFYRAGGLTVAFLARNGRAGLKRIEGISISGRVIDAHATFDANHALLSVTAEIGGKDVVSRWLVSANGDVLASCSGGRAGHAALLAGRVVIGSDDGLVALKSDSGHLIEATCFSDTQPFVSAQDELLALADGSLVVVTSRDIVSLSLS